MSHIATYREGPLHAALKRWCAKPGDRFEVPVDGRQIDIVRGDLLIEIQTKSVGSLRRKIASLLDRHRVHLVLPVAEEKWIVKLPAHGELPIERRRSPKKGSALDAFAELVGIAKLLLHENLSIEVLLIGEEQLRVHEPGKAWRRRGWVIVERRLLDVRSSRTLASEADLRSVLPSELAEEFTTSDLASVLPATPALARKIAYCLREAGIIELRGKRGNSLVYSMAPGGIRPNSSGYAKSPGTPPV